MHKVHSFVFQVTMGQTRFWALDIDDIGLQVYDDSSVIILSAQMVV